MNRIAEQLARLYFLIWQILRAPCIAKTMNQYGSSPFYFPADKVDPANWSLTDMTNRPQVVASNMPHKGNRRQMPPVLRNFSRPATLSIARNLAETENRDTMTVPKEYAGTFNALVNKRRGIGNYEVYRDNFREAPILSRNGEGVESFAQRRALDIQNNGIKIQLGEKTLQDMMWTRVPDETDLEWLAERIRLDAAGLPNALPFNRKQRQKTVKQNIADMVATQVGSATTILNATVQQIAQNRVQSDADVAALTANLNGLLVNINTTSAKLTAKQDQLLMSVLASSAPQLTPSNVGLPYDKAPDIATRFWSKFRFVAGSRLPAKSGLGDLLPGAASPVAVLAYAVSRARYDTSNGFRIDYTGRKGSDPTIGISAIFRAGSKQNPNTLEQHQCFLDMDDGIWKGLSICQTIAQRDGIQEPLDDYSNPRTLDSYRIEIFNRARAMGFDLSKMNNPADFGQYNDKELGQIASLVKGIPQLESEMAKAIADAVATRAQAQGAKSTAPQILSQAPQIVSQAPQIQQVQQVQQVQGAPQVQGVQGAP